MANSSWTAEHIRQLFLSWAPPVRVYPPCDTADLAALPLERKLKRLYLVSLAQVPLLCCALCRTKTLKTLNDSLQLAVASESAPCSGTASVPATAP